MRVTDYNPLNKMRIHEFDDINKCLMKNKVFKYFQIKYLITK